MFVLLDIDGVMVPASTWKQPEFLADGFPVFSIKATQALNKIITCTKCTILLTTSHKTKYSLSDWKNIFELRGIQIDNLERLPENSLNVNRKEEILDWIKTSENKENFVILDDDKSLNGLMNNLKEKLVLTSPLVGLTSEQADEAISILKQELILG